VTTRGVDHPLVPLAGVFCPSNEAVLPPCNAGATLNTGGTLTESPAGSD
jgi:hypothetical protein